MYIFIAVIFENINLASLIYTVQIKGNDRVLKCSTYRRYEKYKVLAGKPEGGICEDGRAVLKLVLAEKDGRMWNGFI
jgi:hypothetical protein